MIIAMVSFHTIGMCNLGELELQERYTKVQPKLSWKNINKTFGILLTYCSFKLQATAPEHHGNNMANQALCPIFQTKFYLQAIVCNNSEASRP